MVKDSKNEVTGLVRGLALGLVGAMGLAGCFTISETERPATDAPVMTAAATNITLAVRGFESMLTEYVVLSGYQTVFYQGCGGRYGCYGPGIGTAHTTTTIPRVRPSEMFLTQARDGFEDRGFNVMASTPDYVVEARFSGPQTSGEDASKSFALLIGSLFTCDYGTQTWQAQLRIHDNRTGRLVLSREYEQRYAVTGFSPIPLLGISGYERTNGNYMQCWCLGVLTDRIVAEATEFLTRGK